MLTQLKLRRIRNQSKQESYICDGPRHWSYARTQRERSSDRRSMTIRRHPSTGRFHTDDPAEVGGDAYRPREVAANSRGGKARSNRRRLSATGSAGSALHIVRIICAAKNGIVGFVRNS